MDFALPQAYLLGLIVLLGVVAVVVGRHVWRVRKQEGQLASFEKRCQETNADAASLYELGSVQLDKRLFAQAASSLKRAAKLSASEPAEARALIQNALGFSLARENPRAFWINARASAGSLADSLAARLRLLAAWANKRLSS